MLPISFRELGVLFSTLCFEDMLAYISMIDHWDEFIVRTTFEVAIGLSQIDVDMYYFLNWTHPHV